MNNFSLTTYKGALIVSLIVLLFFSSLVLSTCSNSENDKIGQLDAMELHYDATGPFIFGDENLGYIGVYNGKDAIYHQIFPSLKTSVYQFKTYSGMILLTYGELIDSVNSLDNDLIEAANSIKVSSQTPVLLKINS